MKKVAEFEIHGSSVRCVSCPGFVRRKGNRTWYASFLAVTRFQWLVVVEEFHDMARDWLVVAIFIYLGVLSLEEFKLDGFEYFSS